MYFVSSPTFMIGLGRCHKVYFWKTTEDGSKWSVPRDGFHIAFSSEVCIPAIHEMDLV